MSKLILKGSNLRRGVCPPGFSARYIGQGVYTGQLPLLAMQQPEAARHFFVCSFGRASASSSFIPIQSYDLLPLPTPHVLLARP